VELLFGIACTRVSPLLSAPSEYFTDSQEIGIQSACTLPSTRLLFAVLVCW